jgi:hypothetical protein
MKVLVAKFKQRFKKAVVSQLTFVGHQLKVWSTALADIVQTNEYETWIHLRLQRQIHLFFYCSSHDLSSRV